MTKAVGTTAAMLLWLALAGGAAAAQACPGDCDGDGGVAINELVLAVTRALGADAGACAAADGDGDGTVQINELIAGVNSALGGCSSEPATRAAVVRRYADLLLANYTDAVAGAEALAAASDAFVADPSPASLEAARAAWLAARPAYLQTEMARFYDGPIDNADTGPEGLLNAWPMNEAYVDYVVDDADAGIINAPDLHPVIDADLLIALNEGVDETTIASGWHAIEFLLWGQDLSDSGPGARPFTDYVTDGSGTAANQARRAAYLTAAAELLVVHLAQVRDAWAEGAQENYRDEFLDVDEGEALRRILTGMGTLSGGELTGERLGVAYETKDQEDEHSCFADNTHVDHRNDQLGIQNAFLGRYAGVTGPGIYDLVRAVDAPLADQTRDAIDAARVAVFAIPVPFDRAIQGPDSSPGRQAISAAIAALNAQTDLIAQSAEALGISISTTLP